MAVIHICAKGRKHSDGPSMPTPCFADITRVNWPGGFTPELTLYIGEEIIHVWPAVPEMIEKLAKQLLDLAQKMKDEAQQQE